VNETNRQSRCPVQYQATIEYERQGQRRRIALGVQAPAFARRMLAVVQRADGNGVLHLERV